MAKATRITGIRIRVEGSDPPLYLTGANTGTRNVAVDGGDALDIYLPVGVEDGETVYRLADRERK